MTVAQQIVGASRRGFLAAGGALTVAVAFGSDPKAAFADIPAGGFNPNAWVNIGADDVITIQFALAEMGQGIKTTLPLLIAEELDADWAKVRIVQSPSDAKTYGGAYGTLGTFGSQSTHGNYERLRLVGAQTRKILLLNAADLWKVPAGELTTIPNAVIHKASGRKIGYGALAKTARVPAPVPTVTSADLKSAADFRYIGKMLPRVDVPSKVNGTAVYGLDVQLPDMLYAAILKAPVQGEAPARIDDKDAKAVPGVIKIVPLTYGVGVIGETVEATKTAKAALKVQWTTKAQARTYIDAAVLKDYQAIGVDPTRPIVKMLEEGDAPAAIKAAHKIVSADYFADHVAHLTMEPMNATALVKGASIEIWASNQSPSRVQSVVGDAAGVSRDTVTVHSTLLGGGFGRRYEGDFALDAYLLAKEMPGRPVKVIWSREDDVQNDPYRPLVVQHLDVGLDAAGEILGWRHRVVGGSYSARTAPAQFEKGQGGKDYVVAGGGDFKYRAGAHLVEYAKESRGIAVGALRGISSGYMVFAMEAMIDELASLKGVDPLAYRVDLLKDDPRGVIVLQTVARMADWGKARPDTTLGLAYSADLGSRVGLIVEISLDKSSGEIKVHTLWCAVDAGLAVQPVNIVAQIEGGLMFGLGPALFEQLNIKNGEVAESNFSDYRVLRMSDIPEIHIEIVQNDHPPTGVGEAGIPAVPPAIANAVARLTGKRLRHLPMLPERVKAALV